MFSEIVDGMGAGEVDSSHGMFFERLDGVEIGDEPEERGITLSQRSIVSQVDKSIEEVSEEDRVELVNVERPYKKLKSQFYDDIHGSGIIMVARDNIGNEVIGEPMLAQEGKAQEEVVLGSVVDGPRRSFMSQINELMGQVSEVNRLEVEGRGEPVLKSKKSRRGKRNERVDGSLMDMTASDTSIAISLSETADTAIVASQISPGHQPGTSLPSVFTSVTAGMNALRHRKLEFKGPRYMSASDFFGKDYEE
jgi:hypothetical protein